MASEALVEALVEVSLTVYFRLALVAAYGPISKLTPRLCRLDARAGMRAHVSDALL